MVSEQAAMWWGGGLCDYCVSPSPFGLDFGTLDFGTLDFGLTINNAVKYWVEWRRGRRSGG